MEKNSQAELAMKLQNPVANLISVPVQFQLDGRYYPEKPNGGADWGSALHGNVAVSKIT